MWRAVKARYNRLPPKARKPYAVAVSLPIETRIVLGAIARGDVPSYVSTWTNGWHRGMSRWHDYLDWVGGYPFEVAKPEEVFEFCRDRGFELENMTTCGGGFGCNEFVFVRRELG